MTDTTAGPRNPAKLPNTFLRELECRLTDEDLKVRGQDLATTIDDKVEVEEKKAEANSGFSSKLKHLNKSIVELAQVVRTRTEIRRVECVKEVDTFNRETSIVRRDTGECIETRPATTQELETASQRKLFSTGAAAGSEE